MIRSDRCLDQDLQFALHACNAYPKLVEALGEAGEGYDLLKELGELYL
jgi:hypothetical protein